MGILSKIKRQARKLMPKELSGIAQMAAPFVANSTANPLLGAALSYLGQARAGEGKINPFKIAMSSAPGLRFDRFDAGRSGTIGDMFKRFNVENKFNLKNQNALNTDKNVVGLRDMFLSGYDEPYTDTEGVFQENNKKSFNEPIFKNFGKTADKFLFGAEKVKNPKFGKVKDASEFIDKSGILGTKGNLSLTDNALINAAIKQGSPFNVGEDLSMLKLGSAGLSIYSFIDTNKQIKTAEEAAAAVEAQMIADGITNQSIIDAATEEAINIFSQLSKADFGLANGGRIGFARGTSEEGIKSLNSGAESITYEGTDGARSPEQTETEQQNLQALGIPKGVTIIDAIKTFKMSIGRDPKGIEEVIAFYKNRKLSEGTPLPNDPTKPVNPFGPKPMKDGMTQMAAAGGRMGFMYGSDMNNMGGLSSLQTQPSDVTPPGMELDLRGGGFIPIGKAEKADDVPARVSKNEFVFTADAVKAAGGGSVNEGAKKMYDTMKQLESQVG